MIRAYNPEVPGSLTTMFREALENNPGYVELKPGEEPSYSEPDAEPDAEPDDPQNPATRDPRPRRTVKAVPDDDATPAKE